jgi:hypothetical protein
MMRCMRSRCLMSTRAPSEIFSVSPVSEISSNPLLFLKTASETAQAAHDPLIILC